MPRSESAQHAKSIHRFVVGMDDKGHWIARDEQGLTGGVFLDRAAAIRFAVTESDHQAGAVCVIADTARLSLFH